MIQRLQTLYLAFTTLLTLLLVKGTLFSFTEASGNIIKLIPDGLLKDSAGQTLSQIKTIWPLTLLFILIPLFSVVTILLFKNRKMQLLFSITVLILSSVLVVVLSCYSLFIIDNYNASVIPGVKMAVPVIILVFAFLAYRGIMKDDNLIKSYDRLR
jgi:hypothetical protein